MSVSFDVLHKTCIKDSETLEGRTMGNIFLNIQDVYGWYSKDEVCM